MLVNNAGTTDDGPLEEQSLEELTSVIDLNLVALMDMCGLAAHCSSPLSAPVW